MRPTLEPGKLYQVKKEKGWVIAEYLKEAPAHSYKYHNMNMNTFTIGDEKTRSVPLSHVWKKVRALDGAYPNTFTVADRGMEVRPVTEDAIAEIAKLKAEIIQANDTVTAKRRELKEFCD